MIRIFFSTMLAVVAGFTALQVRAAGPDVPAREVSLQFSVFSLGGAEGLVYRPTADKAPRALKFYSAYRSAQYVYRGGETLAFYDAKDAGPGAKPAATYTVPEGATKLLLLFFPRETPSADGVRYDVYGVNDDDARAPAGHFTTINVSGRDYVGQYSGHRIAIPQGIGEAHAGRGRVSLQLAAQIEGAWMATGKHEFSMAPGDRVTLIFYPSASRTGVYPIIRRLVDAGSLQEGGGQGIAQYP